MLEKPRSGNHYFCSNITQDIKRVLGFVQEAKVRKAIKMRERGKHVASGEA